MPEMTPVDAVRELVDQSEFYAARGERPPIRTMHGSAEQIWGTLHRGPFAAARSEWRSFDDCSLAASSDVRESIHALCMRSMRGLVERGVRVRQVTTSAGMRADPSGPLGMPWRRQGQTRLTDSWPFKALLVDRRLAILPADLAVLSHGVRFIADPVVVAAIERLHTRLWDSGRSVDQQDGPPAHLARIVSLLGAGLTDDAAARELGVSSRTYSRRMSELMRVLEVRSRFEAGVAAHRRGWID